MKLSARTLWLILLGVIIAVVPQFAPGGFGQAVIAFVGFYTLATLGLQVLMGYAGQFSVGHAAFFGIGAYAYGIFATRLGVPTWGALLLAAVCNAALAYLIGRPIFRLRGPQLALATLVLGIIASTVFMQATWLTGGALGMGNIPSLSVAGFVFSGDMRSAYLALAFAYAMLVLADNLMRSRVGRSLKALSADEQVSASLGIDTMQHKLAIFVVSAVLTGLGGTLYASYLTYISPDAFTFILSVELLLMAIVGGLGSIWGAPAGAALVVLLGQGLDGLSRGLPAGSDVILKSVVFGGILIALVIYLPDGVTRGVQNFVRRLGARIRRPRS